MKLRFLLFSICFLPLFVSAQKEGANWYFGRRIGLDFNSGAPVPKYDGQVSTLEGVATISDRNGNLLFYTDGITVYDRNHSVMPNGQNLKGNISSTQSAIIVPKPKAKGIYYLFTVDKPDYTYPEDDPIEGVNYSVIDMSLNSGYGDIVSGQKNIQLPTFNPNDPNEAEYKSSEKISAVIAGDCESYWVVTQFTNKFYAFKVSSSGLDTNPVITTVSANIPPTTKEDNSNKTAIGYMKISPNGKLLAIAHANTVVNSGPKGGTSKNNGKVYLYDFDDITGQVSNQRSLLDNAYPYGVEFSPKSRKLYITTNYYTNGNVLDHSELLQFDLNSSNIASSKTVIQTNDFTAGALQLAIDGKIYRSGYPFLASGYDALSVINEPEKDGRNCNYKQDAIKFSGDFVTLGLPQFIQSLLKNEFNSENLCLGDATHFYVNEDNTYDTVEWDFGDGTTGTGKDVIHTYSSPGSYTVNMYAYISGVLQEPVCSQIDISENPEVLSKYDLVQCDIYDDDPEDGIAEFNLQLAKEPVSMGSTTTQVYFYPSESAARQDTSNSNALNNIYTNTSPNQKLYAKVTSFGSLCYSISEVTLKTKNGTNIFPDPVYGCDLGDGTAEFNLEYLKRNIVNDYGLPQNIDLTFHLTAEEASLGLRPLPSTYVSEPHLLFIRAESDNICYGSGKVELKIGSVPDLPEIITKEACSSEFPLKIGDEVNIDPSQYDLIWSNGNSGPTTTISTGGVYNLEVIDKQLGCSRSVEFDITEKLSPVINDVLINSELDGSQVEVVAEPNGEGFYAIDSAEGEFQTTPLFNDITPGPHTVYLKNQNECELISRDIFVFGFPNYFTPNNDNIHDFWMPFEINDPEYRIKGVFIYDRYGKLLKQLFPGDNGWDGNFNGYPMPANDYWFQTVLENGRIFKGHFTLLR